MTRQQYLCELAAVMHCPPPVVDRLTITDFAQLVAGINQHRAEMPKAAAG